MKILKVNGMHCAHCKAAVEEAAGRVAGVKNAQVNLETKTLSYEEASPVDEQALRDAISAVGFDPE